MIKLKDIKRHGDFIETWVDSVDFKKSYKMVFNYKTEEFECSIKDPPPFDSSKIIFKLTEYIRQNKPLPEKTWIVWG